MTKGESNEVSGGQFNLPLLPGHGRNECQVNSATELEKVILQKS